MKRRKFLIGTASTTGLLLGGGALGFYLNKVEDRSILTLVHSLDILESFKGQSLVSIGSWSPAQVFIHCAKSIDFSMIGFPEHKSDFFKSALGSNAFATFEALGKMTHALDEPIPGEETLTYFESETVKLDDALALLIEKITAFITFDNELKQHFAYGKLSKNRYEIAHAMHINNHLSEISIQS